MDWPAGAEPAPSALRLARCHLHASTSRHLRVKGREMSRRADLALRQPASKTNACARPQRSQACRWQSLADCYRAESKMGGCANGKRCQEPFFFPKDEC